MTTPAPGTVARFAFAGLAVASGVAADDGAPFCTITADLVDGDGAHYHAIGQMTPGEVIRLAVDWIIAAQIARDDAGIVDALETMLVDLGSTAEDAKVTAVGVLGVMRDNRTRVEELGESRVDDRPRPPEAVPDEEPGE